MRGIANPRRRAVLTALGLGLGATGAAMWWRRNPSACPYSQRFWLELPRPLLTRARLREALEPAAGSTILEVGPGTGFYSLPVADWIGPTGRLHVFDLQEEMLAHTLRRADAAGLANLVPCRGDARQLPYADDAFDAAYLVAVLGEIPDQQAALNELARVLRPCGRLVVGELFGDPHMVRITALRERAGRAGLRFQRRVGPRFGYFAVLEKPSD